MERIVIIAAALFCIPIWAGLPHTVEVKRNQLTIDSQPQPQLFGAEVQYFRLRGGYGPNVPRKTVIDLWNKALDRVVEAKMNAISFYIPWDFHEYAEGKFDFTGSVDEDGDGNPDYPSRDLVTFFSLVKAHGIKKIMVRPGPYVNAEWGHFGFGAIPEWFHHNYPDSHMTSSSGLHAKLFDYLDPQFLKSTRLWFEALYNQVLKYNIGPKKPIVFLQLDNETNYQWQSMFEQDYGSRALIRYQEFLKKSYGDISKLNSAQNQDYLAWNQVKPPTEPGKNIGQDQDWYRFADFTMYSYIHEVRKIWEDLGVNEPQVLFTSAESFNAPENGILPNYIYRNSPHTTGLMTVNLYPKTFETDANPLLNFPFKADLDVKAADEANDLYFGSHQEWVMGPEIQGGWWKGINISPESRQQTYLTVIGHGLKSFFIYYFNEGNNWGVHWGKDQVTPIFENLKKVNNLNNVSVNDLSDDFWGELQALVDKTVVTGLDVKGLIKSDNHQDEKLFFDSPLDGDANPREHFNELKKIGEQVVHPYQDFLGRSLEVNDSVAFVKDTSNHLPSPNKDINSLYAAADWSGGLLGYLMNAGVNPHILIGDFTLEKYFVSPKVIVHVDTDLNSPRTAKLIGDAFNRGQTVVNFLGSQMAEALGFKFVGSSIAGKEPLVLKAYLASNGNTVSKNEPSTKTIEFTSENPAFSYDLVGSSAKYCKGILYSQEKVVGYKCQIGRGTFIQVGALIFNYYNTSNYATLPEVQERKGFLKSLLSDKLAPLLEFSVESHQIVAFARRDPNKKVLWITVKSGLKTPQRSKLKINKLLLKKSLEASDKYKVTDLLSKETQILTLSQLVKQGVDVQLGPDGSTVYVVEKK